MATPDTFTANANKSTPVRNVWRAMSHGLMGRCPHCGSGRLFASFLKPVHSCESCDEEFHHQRADDLPPYLVIFIVGHIVVGGYLLSETMMQLNSWQHLAIWSPITVLMALLMMQPIKGAVVGLQWANYMHGFGGQKDDIVEILQPE